MSTTLELPLQSRVENRCLIVTDCPRLGGELLQHVTSIPAWEDSRVLAGPEAQTNLLESEYDLAVLDWDSLGNQALSTLRTLVRINSCPPVLVLVAAGEEACVVEALTEGAWSYLPRDEVSSRLSAMMELARRRRDLHSLQVAHGRLSARGELVLGCDLAEVSGVVQLLADQMRRVGQCGETERMRVGIAIEEALLNAIIHGNLAIHSDLREREDDAFERLISRRRQQPQYRQRVVCLRYQITPSEARISIRDEGQGFDNKTVPDPTAAEQLTRQSGRGLLLMRTFLDEVRFNECGNEVTLVKRMG